MAGRSQQAVKRKQGYREGIVGARAGPARRGIDSGAHPPNVWTLGPGAPWDAHERTSGQAPTADPAVPQTTPGHARRPGVHPQHAQGCATFQRAFGSSPNISGAYKASARVGGSAKSPALFRRSVYSTTLVPLGR